MKVLIVGASSYIGFHIFQYLNKKYNVIGTYLTNKRVERLIHLNILLKEEVKIIISEYKPDVVIWIAGSKDIKLCEQDENYAYSINTQPIIDYVKIPHKHKFIFISTNYVFDGVTGKYKDCDKPSPLTVYGKTNYLAEQALLKSSINYNIIRTSAVIGKGGIFYEWLKASIRNNLRIPMHDSYFSPTPIELLIEGIDFLISNDEYKKIVHICGELILSRYEFANKIQQLMKNNKSEIIRKDPSDPLFLQDLTLIQSELCSSFQKYSSLEYIQREAELYD